MSRTSSKLSSFKTNTMTLPVFAVDGNLVLFINPSAGVYLSSDKEHGFEKGQSVLLLEKYSTVPAVLAACSDVVRGEITLSPFSE